MTFPREKTLPERFFGRIKGGGYELQPAFFNCTRKTTGDCYEVYFVGVQAVSDWYSISNRRLCSASCPANFRKVSCISGSVNIDASLV